MDADGPFDVAIAGAGLAGASLALRLARRGARVALLDAHTFPRDKLCGEYLSPESWGVLGRLGLADAVSASGYQPIRRLRLSSPRGRVAEADAVGPDGRPAIGLSRSWLDDRLVSEARAAGVSVFEGCRVGGPLVEGGRVVGLAARHPTRGPFDLRTALVVAANGRHSALVRQTGTTRTRSLRRPGLFGLKRHLTIRDPEAAEPAGTVGLHTVPGGYVGTCRVDGPLTNLCGLLPESALRRQRGDLDAVARAVFARNPVLDRLWSAAEPAGDWKTVAGVRVEFSTPTTPGILYAGDCQGTVDPLGGQGMTMALLGAEALEPFALEAIRSGAGPDLQRACQRAWHRRFDRRVRLCRLFHHALIHPASIDAAALLPFGGRVLTACYGWTRDRFQIPGFQIPE